LFLRSFDRDGQKPLVFLFAVLLSQSLFRNAQDPAPITGSRLAEQQVLALGVPRQQNLSASIHTTIRRLLDAGEIERAGDPDLGGGYRWKTPPMVRVGSLGVHRLPGKAKKDLR